MSDFQEYWSAYQLASANLNPYDVVQMRSFQREHFQNTTPIMMWNPPWLLLLLAPILMLPYDLSWFVWQTLSIGCWLAASCYWVKKLWPEQIETKSYPILILLLLLFAPAWNCLLLGQLSLILLGGFTLFCYALTNQKFHYSLIGLSVMSLKPHLFLLLIVPYGLSLIKHNFSKLIKLTFGFVILVISTEVIFQDSCWQWLNSSNQTSQEIVSLPQEWIGTTFFGAMRTFLYPQSSIGYQINMILWLVIFFSWSVYLIFKPKELSDENIPWIMAFSVYFSSFGWFFDQSLFLPFYIQALMFLEIYFRKYIMVAVALIGIKLFIIYFLFNLAQYQHELFWYGPILSLLYLIGIVMSPNRQILGAR